MYYFQKTDLGTMQAGLENGSNSLGQWDLYQVTYDGSSYQFKNTGIPLNTSNNDVEFFITSIRLISNSSDIVTILTDSQLVSCKFEKSPSVKMQVLFAMKM